MGVAFGNSNKGYSISNRDYFISNNRNYISSSKDITISIELTSLTFLYFYKKSKSDFILL